jgi:predicted PurR-regulated permease PerM
MNVQWLQRATFLVFIVFILFLDFQIFRPFFSAMIWAAVLAIFLFPVHSRIAARMGKPNGAALVSLFMVVVLLVVPAVTIGAACVQQGIAMSKKAPTQDILPKIQAGVDWVRAKVPVPIPDMQDKLLDIAQTVGSYLARNSAQVAGDAAGFVMNMGIMLLTLFFLFRDGPEVVSFLRDTAPTDRETTAKVFNEVATMVTVTLQSTVVVAMAQGTVAGLVFWILGLPAPVFWGVVSGLLSFLPVIGPALVWGTAAIILAISGEYWRAVAMLLLGNFGISGIDNILRPILISGRAQLNALMSMVSVLGGIYAFGLLGMVLGPLVVAITAGMLKGYRESLQAVAEPPDAPAE